MSTSKALQRAEASFAARRWAEAIVACRDLAAADPDDARVPALAGAALLQAGRYAEAVTQLERSVSLAPRVVQPRIDLGLALLVLRRVSEAEASFRVATSIQPSSAEAWANLGDALAGQRRWDEALEAYAAALRLRPEHARVLNNRGNVHRELGKGELAVRDYRASTSTDPSFALAWSNLSAALAAQREFSASLEAAREAVLLQPGSALAISQLALALRDGGQVDEALEAAERAVAIAPRSPRAVFNRAWLLEDVGRRREAFEGFERTLELEPANPEAALARAHALLREGRYREGWAGYDARTRGRGWSISAPPGLPLLQGPGAVGDVAIVAEQALGDTIQFARFGRQIEAAGLRAVLRCAPRLVRLLSTAPGFIEARGHGEERTDSAEVAWFPLMSVPRLLGLDTERDIAAPPYLRGEPGRSSHWREWLAARVVPGELRVGIAWQGNPKTERANLLGRSWPLAVLAPLARLPNVRLVCLQRGPGLDQLEHAEFSSDLLVPGPNFDDGPDAFIDSAALMESLDAIVTSDSAVAHLAGALGRPTLIGLHHRADWRWGAGGKTTTWYPTAILYRQTRRGDWRDVVDAIAGELVRRSAVQL